MTADLQLLPCPFCGAGKTIIKPNTYWTGMRSEISSVEVLHWCDQEQGVRGSMVTIRSKTEIEAVARWNRRVI